MGLSVSDDVLAAVVRRVDADGNGSIDFNEFATYLWPNMTVDLILDDRKRDKRSKVSFCFECGDGLIFKNVFKIKKSKQTFYHIYYHIADKFIFDEKITM